MPYTEKQLEAVSGYYTLQKLPYNNAFRMEDHKNALLHIYDRPDFSLPALEKAIRQIFPHYPGEWGNRSPEIMARRAALSQEAQSIMLDTHLHNQQYFASAETDTPLPGAGLKNPWQAFVRTSSQEADLAFNRGLEACFEEKDPQKTADYLFAEIQRCAGDAGIHSRKDLFAMLDRPDSQLVPQFPAIMRYAALMNAANRLWENRAAQFNEEQSRYLSSFTSPAINLSAAFAARIEMIADPLYREIDPGFLLNHPMGKLSFHINNVSNKTNLPFKLVNYFTQADIYNGKRGCLLEEHFRHKYPALQNAEFGFIGESTAEAFEYMEPVVAATRDKELFVVTGGQPEKVRSHSSYLAQLLAETEATDRWLLTGSRAFRDMTKALRQITEYCQTNSKPDLNRLQALNEQLHDAACEYLQYKHVPDVYGHDMTIGFGKNAREQRRLDVAYKIMALTHGQQKALEKANEVEHELDDVSSNALEQDPEMLGLKVPSGFDEKDSAQRFVGNKPEFIEEVYRQDEIDHGAYEHVEGNDPALPKWEFALKVRTDLAQEQLKYYVNGYFRPDDMVGTNATVKYIDQIPMDIAALAFKEALVMENEAMNGTGVLQTLLQEKGYDAALQQFSALATAPDMLSAAGLKGRDGEDIAQFLNGNGPRKLAKQVLQPDTPQPEQSEEGIQATHQMNSSQPGIAPNMLG